MVKNNDIRFLKHMIKWEKDNAVFKTRVHYSKGNYTKESGLPKGTVTIYSKDYYPHGLPKELFPENDTDMMTDYFEKDRARIKPNNKYYKDVMKIINKLPK